MIDRFPLYCAAIGAALIALIAVMAWGFSL